MEPESNTGVIDSSPKNSRVPPSSMVKVEPQVKVCPLISKVPSTTSHVEPVVKLVEREAEPDPVLFTWKGPVTVPAFCVMVEVPEPEPPIAKVRFAPPKASVVDILKLPWTVRVKAEAGLLTTPSVRVKAPEKVQALAKVSAPLLVLFKVTPPKASLPHVRVVVRFELSKVTVPLL